MSNEEITLYHFAEFALFAARIFHSQYKIVFVLKVLLLLYVKIVSTSKRHCIDTKKR
jgi:hypothetical protein